MSTRPFPARLHVLVPSHGTDALILRRGPSKRVCTLWWDLRTDAIQVGQWLKGRIYEGRADISPSGQYWIYFALNGKLRDRTGGQWTAIARVPWLKALDLYGKPDCLGGGGLFSDETTYWVSDCCSDHTLLDASDEVERTLTHPIPGLTGIDRHYVYRNRLLRDGWYLVDLSEPSENHSIELFRKIVAGRGSLTKICHGQLGPPEGKGCYWDEHRLVTSTGSHVEGSDWEWADVIGGQVCFAAKGCLYRMAITDYGHLTEPRLIHDLNNYSFERIQAPY